MATRESKSIMTSLMNYLYASLTDGMEAHDPANAAERFITWCLPGIPIAPTELAFMTRGLVGRGDTPEAREEDTKLLLGQAARFAKLVDFVPQMSGQHTGENQLVAFHPNSDSLTRTYERVLIQSKVAKQELTAEEQAKILAIRDRLYPEVTRTDDDTGEQVTERPEGPRIRNYKKHMAAYNAAFIAYNAARVRGGTEFAFNEPALFSNVRLALDAWETGGHRSELEGQMATLAQITGRDLTLWKRDVIERFRKGTLNDPLLGPFQFSTLIPGDFLRDEAGWPRLTFTEEHVDKHLESHHTQFKVKASLIGGLTFGGSGDYTKDVTRSLDHMTNFKMQLEVAQVPLVITGIDPPFLTSRAWMIGSDVVELGTLSDGKVPPSGQLVAYPTAVIFVRNVAISSDEITEAKTDIAAHVAAKGRVGWGPFSLGGRYKRDDHTTDTKVDTQHDGLSVEGVQILGFRCHLFGKLPDPLPSIPAEAFV